jgi:hypothetical protein
MWKEHVYELRRETVNTDIKRMEQLMAVLQSKGTRGVRNRFVSFGSVFLKNCGLDLVLRKTAVCFSFILSNAYVVTVEFVIY